MNKDEILYAVKAGQIDPEMAAQELRKIIKVPQADLPDQPSLGAAAGSDSVLNQEQQLAVTITEIGAEIVQVTMQDRINKNTFSYELIAGLMHAFELIRINPNYKVVILTGYDSFFASGGNQRGIDVDL